MAIAARHRAYDKAPSSFSFSAFAVRRSRKTVLESSGFPFSAHEAEEALSSAEATFTVAPRLRHAGLKSQQPQRASGTPEQVVKIYKICLASAWREAERLGVYCGSADDARDGFIHFSTATQVAETLRKHFFGQRALFLVEVEADALGASLRWERSRNDELFPHLYGELDLGAVIAVVNLNMRADGSHDIPELAP